MDSLSETIKEINRISQKLIKISQIKNQKFCFKRDYTKLLFKKWRENRGKHIINLFDLPDYITVRFNDKGQDQLQRVYFDLRKIGFEKLSRKHNINLYLLHSYIKGKSVSLTIKFLRELSILLPTAKINFNVKDLEKNVASIRTGIKGNSLKLEHGFPINLNQEEWAFIFGVIPDSNIKKFELWSTDRNLLNQVSSNLNKIGIENSVRGNRTGEVKIISIVLSFSGIDTTKNQLSCNNGFPYWFFNTSKEFQAIVLSKLIDTEGNVNKGMIRIAQSSLIDLSDEEANYIISKNKTYVIKQSNCLIYKVPYTELPNRLKEKVLANPPLILISAQLLLMKNGICSVLYPKNICISKNNYTIGWNLNIQDYMNLSKFYELSEKYLVTNKKRKIEESLKNRCKGRHLSNRMRIPYYISYALKIQTKKGHFTSNDLVGITKRKRKTIGNTMGYLAQLNLIWSLGKIEGLKRWKLTKEGRKYYQKDIDLID